MNIHMIHGRLVRDPEYKRSAESESKDRAKFTVAVDRRYGDETDFFECTVFGKRANVIDKYFHKGSEILISGEGQIRKYTDKNGVDRWSYGIVVGDFDFCGSKSDGSNNQANAPKPTQTQQPPAEPEPTPDGFEEINEDIPF